MQYFREKYENVHFLLFGDDPKWNQQEIVDKNTHFNDAQVMPKSQTPGIDLCLLSKFVQFSQFSNESMQIFSGVTTQSKLREHLVGGQHS